MPSLLPKKKKKKKKKAAQQLTNHTSNVTLTPATVNDNPIIDYRVPNTAISLKIQTGAALSSVAIRNTLIACRGQIARSIYNWGTVSEIDPDPYVYPPKGSFQTPMRGATPFPAQSTVLRPKVYTDTLPQGRAPPALNWSSTR